MPRPNGPWNASSSLRRTLPSSGGAEAEIHEAEMDIGVLGIGVHDQPGAGACRIEPLDRGNPIAVGVPAVCEQLLAQLGSEEFHGHGSSGLNGHPAGRNAPAPARPAPPRGQPPLRAAGTGHGGGWTDSAAGPWAVRIGEPAPATCPGGQAPPVSGPEAPVSIQAGRDRPPHRRRGRSP